MHHELNTKYPHPPIRINIYKIGIHCRGTGRVHGGISKMKLSNEKESILWLEEIFCGKKKIDASWLGDGTTSDKIIQQLKVL